MAGLQQFDQKADIANIRLGTTVATNALLERTGATVAYVTTKGHRDVLFIQRGNRKFHYDMSWVKPKPLAKRRHCFEIVERLSADGEVVTPLDEAQTRAVARQIAALPEVSAVAVMLLFSYINPAHELRVKEIFAEEAPGLPVSISFEVLPKWKEYERASTTVADAYLKPIVSAQLRQMRQRFADEGVTQHAVVIKSNGGEMTLEAAADRPIEMTVSGPTGGVVAGSISPACSVSVRLVTLDMGGTSTDVSTIVDGKENFTTTFEIDWGVPIQIPMIDIRIDRRRRRLDRLDRQGRHAARRPAKRRRKPGPACYGRGGVGGDGDRRQSGPRPHQRRQLPRRLACGLTSSAAEAAVGRMAAQLGMTPDAAASRSSRSPTTTWWARCAAVLIERGLDPRDFTLMGFGGAGPLHACDLMLDTGIPTRHHPEPSWTVLRLRLHPRRCPRRPPAHDATDIETLRSGAGDAGDDGACRGRRRRNCKARAMIDNIEVVPHSRDALPRPEL